MTLATVVIPYFEDQRCLDLVLAALELQSLPADAFEVVVADDGSRAAPEPGARPYPVLVVRQDDLGCRPAAARNLGARAGTGAILAFLDGDTVPEPRYLEALLDACDGRRLTVGRRRHADLSDTSPADLRRWLADEGPAPEVLPEPAWLADGYARTRDLADADLRSYRYVISAVLACPRALFERVGGFAEEINGYGGEDWEFARRCWLAGADLAHAPEAVAWHDGPDLEGRPAVGPTKNGETLRIAGLLTDPHLRGRGLAWPFPGGVGVWLGTDAGLPIADPRVHVGLPSATVLGRCELVIDVLAPVAADAAAVDRWQAAAPARCPSVVVRSPRDVALGLEPRDLPEPPQVPADVELERWFDGRAR